MRFPALSAAAGLALAVAATSSGAACRRATPAAASKAGVMGAVGAGGATGEVSAARGVHLALLYSANLQGEFEPCDCPTQPLGGLARRATVFERARAEADGVLAVDAGDLLLPAGDGPPATPRDRERRARLMLEAYARLGVAAFLPAERDLALGVAALQRLLKDSGVPAVAANLMGRDGRPLFERDRLVTAAGIPVGIFGLVAPQPGEQASWERWGVRAADPVETARAEIASLRARGARMIVALLHLGPAAAARALLEAAPGITWAVQGHAGMQYESPEVVGGARLLDAMSQGRLAGRLDIHVVGGATADFRDRDERAQVLAILDDHRRQLADLERRADDDKTDQLRDYYRLRREGLTGAIARDVALAQRLPTALPGSWFQNHIIPLDPSIPEQPAMAALVHAYASESARRTARRR